MKHLLKSAETRRGAVGESLKHTRKKHWRWLWFHRTGRRAARREGVSLGLDLSLCLSSPCPSLPPRSPFNSSPGQRSPIALSLPTAGVLAGGWLGRAGSVTRRGMTQRRSDCVPAASTHVEECARNSPVLIVAGAPV